MSETTRLRYLKIVLVLVGIIFSAGLYTLMIGWPSLWPSGWAWHSGHSPYPMMIVGVYATLGVFLLIAARDPLRHLSIIWFAVWSSVVHAAIMAVQSFTGEHQHGHLVGDVPALLLVAAALAALVPRTGNGSLKRAA